MQGNYKEVKVKTEWKLADLNIPSFLLTYYRSCWALRPLQVRQVIFPVNMTP